MPDFTHPLVLDRQDAPSPHLHLCPYIPYRFSFSSLGQQHFKGKDDTAETR